jgi:hypothetical protein
MVHKIIIPSLIISLKASSDYHLKQWTHLRCEKEDFEIWKNYAQSKDFVLMNE